MGHLLGAIDQARLDEQRGVVQNEKRQGENAPYGRSGAHRREHLPAGHPYSWTIIGSMEDLNAASLDDVKEWFSTYYGPANATLVVAGDVDPETCGSEVEKLLRRHSLGPARPDPAGVDRQADRRPSPGDAGSGARRPASIRSGTFPCMAAQTRLSLAGRVILSRGKPPASRSDSSIEDRIASDIGGYTDEREIASQFLFLATAQPGGDLKRWSGPSMRRSGSSSPRPHPGGARAGQDSAPRRLHSRNRAHRGLRREVGCACAGTGIPGRPSNIQDHPAAHCERHRRPASGRREPLARDGVYVLEVHPFANTKP